MSTTEWNEDKRAFLGAREAARNKARQRIALQILCGEDLDTVLAFEGERKEQLCRRLKRLIERERLKGASGHWSYDLNRHIGLKQALESLKAAMPDK